MRFTTTLPIHTATGVNALSGDVNFGNSGSNNTATGFEASLPPHRHQQYATGALRSKTTHRLSNSADGFGALASNTIGNYNTASGHTFLTLNSVQQIHTAWESTPSLTTWLTIYGLRWQRSHQQHHRH